MRILCSICLATLFGLVEGIEDRSFSFVDAQATSTNVGTSQDEFSPKRALQPGTGYWCSEGNHDDDTVVSWVGNLDTKVSLRGLKIRWAYSPQQIQISVSPDGVNEHEVLAWKATPSQEKAFDEDVYFDRADTAQTVKISMKGPINKYFGITEVTPIAASSPIVMLLSGITHGTSELCLQVAGGRMHVDNAPVVVDYCSYAIAAGDGRELWRFNDKKQIQCANSNPPSCLVLEGANTTNGGNVVVQSCKSALDAGDDRSIWEYLYNGQLKLAAKGGHYVLSQQGAGAGHSDATLGQPVKATASSVSDKQHSASSVIDGNPKTYWASGAFHDEKEHNVLLDLDLKVPTRVDKIRIDWEFPPLKYQIGTSQDAGTYVTVASSTANPANTTTSEVNGQIARYVRITMEKPHPRYGKFNGRFIYGIRGIQVLKNKLASIVQEEAKAANTPDARDKFFKVPVREFDASLSDTMVQMYDNLSARISAVEDVAGEVTEFTPALDRCHEDITAYRNRTQTNADKVTDTRHKLKESGAEELTLISAQLAAGLTFGDTAPLAATDCRSIKKRNPSAISGFYWLAPRCAPSPFRAWCDMETEKLVYVWNGVPSKTPNTNIANDVNSLDSLRLHCAEMGLEPFALTSKQEISSTVNVLSKMGFDFSEKGYIPLAYDVGCDTGKCSAAFRDLATGNDVTSILLTSTSADVAQGLLQGFNAAGLGGGSSTVQFFDLHSSPISAILCSTNVASDVASAAVPIECTTVAQNNPVFQGASDTNIIVDCPPGCEEDATLAVYGSNGLYHEASSVCRAAIHAGVIKNGGLVNVALENNKSRFSGMLENGVRSQSLEVDDNTRSIRVGLIPHDCPIDLVGDVPITSFLQVSSSLRGPSEDLTRDTKRIVSHGKSVDVLHLAAARASTLKPLPLESTRFLQVPSVTSVLVTPEMNEVLTETYDYIDEVHGVDPALVKLVAESTQEVLAQARGKLKPAAELLDQQTRVVMQLYQQSEDFASTLYQTTGSHLTSLDEVSASLATLEEKRRAMHGFESWKWSAERDLLPLTFKTSLSFGVTGEPDWVYSEDGSLMHRGTNLRELQAAGAGTYALVTNRRWFDFIFTARIRLAEHSVGGVAFRARSPQDLYLLELDHAAGTRSLVRLANGAAKILCHVKDGGFVPDVWYQLHIETSHGRIRVCMAEAGQPLDELFDVQDETILSGTVGAFAAETNNARVVEFAALEVVSKYCSGQGCLDTVPPLPLDCNVVTDEYTTRFNAMWKVVDATKSEAGPSKWSYDKRKGDRPTVISQKTAVRDSKDGFGTMAIMSGRRSCEHGQISFDFSPGTLDGAIGVVFRYKDINNYSALKLTQENAQLISANGSGINIMQPTWKDGNNFIAEAGEWHHLTLTFNGPAINVVVQPLKDPEATAATASFMSTSISKDIAVYKMGLATDENPGTLFDFFSAGPAELMNAATVDATSFSVVSQSVMSSSAEPHWKICCQPLTWIQRQNTCQRLYSDLTLAARCSDSFCDSCCERHTSLLSATKQTACRSSCEEQDYLANSSRDAWLSVLRECLGDLHSSTVEGCTACCQTHSALDDLRPSSGNHFVWARESAEVSACVRFCKLGHKNHID